MQKEIKEQINDLKGRLFLLESKAVLENTATLVSEILNLRDGVGDGYREEDYYAPKRYYSKIKGVKNISIDYFDEEMKAYKVCVKVVAQSGFLLPAEVEIDGKSYKIYFVKSKNYDDTCDY